MEALWTESDLAEYLGVSIRTLQRQRVAGDGVPFLKLGQRVRYRPADIQTFLDRARRTSTSDPGAHP